MKLLVVSIPEERWRVLDLASAVENAVDAGRRIRKNIDIKRERKRFSAACSLIEGIAMQNLKNDSIELEGDIVDNLVESFRNDGITYPFVLPADMPKLLKNLKGGALVYLRRIQGGIVVLPFLYENLPYSHPTMNNVLTPPKPSTEPQISLPDVDPKKNYLCNRRLVEIAHHQIREALVSNQPLNASYISHEVFTEVIRCYLHRKSGSISLWQRIKRQLRLLFEQWHSPPPLMLRIAYSDGSEGKPFPILCFSEKQRPIGLRVIRAGLTSLRHSASLDPLVDIYLLRNKEIDARDTSAEQDALAYDKVLRFLADALSSKEKIELHLYHTGLEPAVVGAYRAVIEMLHKHRNRLVVVPVFIREAGYQEAEAWF